MMLPLHASLVDSKSQNRIKSCLRLLVCNLILVHELQTLKDLANSLQTWAFTPPQKWWVVKLPQKGHDKNCGAVDLQLVQDWDGPIMLRLRFWPPEWETHCPTRRTNTGRGRCASGSLSSQISWRLEAQPTFRDFEGYMLLMP